MSTQMGGRGEGAGEERDLDRKAHTNGTTAQNHRLNFETNMMYTERRRVQQLLHKQSAHQRHNSRRRPILADHAMAWPRARFPARSASPAPSAAGARRALVRVGDEPTAATGWKLPLRLEAAPGQDADSTASAARHPTGRAGPA